MKLKNTQLVKLPPKAQFSLYLIREELKSRKLFHALQKVGFVEPYFQPSLDTLILDSIGIEQRSDETFTIYWDILERRSKKIKADNESIMKQALKVYGELMVMKEKTRVTT